MQTELSVFWQAKKARVGDRLLWMDGFQSSEALSALLLCSAVFLAPFDEQSSTSVCMPDLS